MCLGLVGLLIHSFFMLLFFVFILYFFFVFFFFSSRRRHTRCLSDWSSDVCSSDLKDSKVVSFARLRDSLGVSRATLKRDLVYMRDRFNAPIEYVRAGNGYRFGKPRAGPRYELPGLWFNATEIYALLTTLQLLSNLHPGLLDGQVPALVERLHAILGRGDRSWQEIQKRIRIFQPERRAGDAAWFSVIAAALLKRSRL